MEGTKACAYVLWMSTLPTPKMGYNFAFDRVLVQRATFAKSKVFPFESPVLNAASEGNSIELLLMYYS